MTVVRENGGLCSEEDRHATNLLRRAATEDMDDSWPSVPSTASTESLSGSPGTMTEYLAHQLRIAERALAIQHRETLDVLAAKRRDTGGFEDKVDPLVLENKALRDELAQLKQGYRSPLDQSKQDGAQSKENTQVADMKLELGNKIGQLLLPERPSQSPQPSPPSFGTPPQLGLKADQAIEPMDPCIESIDMQQMDSVMKDNFKLIAVWNMPKRKSSKGQKGSSSRLSVLRQTLIDGVKAGDESDEDEDLVIDDFKSPIMVSNSCMGRRIVHPYNPRKGTWDIISLILVVYDVFYIPLGFFPIDPNGWFLQFMKWLTRFFWSIDFPASFFCGFVTADGSIELRPWRIAKRYLKSWFVLDVLVVCVDWLEFVLSEGGSAFGLARFSKVSRVLRILRMVRLLRLARMREVLDGLIEKMNSEKLVIVIDIVKLMAYMLGTGHFVACMWYIISTTTTPNWVTIKEEVNPGMYFQEHCDPIAEGELKGVEDNACAIVSQLYIMSLRWAVSQFAGGMDEVTPVHLAEHIYAAFVYLASFWSGAVFIGILTSSMTNLYMISSQQTTQLTVLRRYLKQNEITKTLALRVTRNAQYALRERNSATPEAAVELVKFVSEPLRVELHFEMYGPTLQIHPFFQQYMLQCPHVMQRVCHNSVHMQGISKGDVVFNVGEIPKKPRLFIITHGELNYWFGKGATALKSVLKPQSWICEGCLWVNWVHRGMLTAKEYTRMYSLDAVEFQSIASSFEHGNFDPRDYAQEYLRILNALEPEDVTDLPLLHQMMECKGIDMDDPHKAIAKEMADEETNVKKKSSSGRARDAKKKTKEKDSLERDTSGSSSPTSSSSPRRDKNVSRDSSFSSETRVQPAESSPPGCVDAVSKPLPTVPALDLKSSSELDGIEEILEAGRPGGPSSPNFGDAGETTNWGRSSEQNRRVSPVRQDAWASSPFIDEEQA